MKNTCVLFVGLWIAGLTWLSGAEAPEPDWPRLMEIGKRYGMPLPDASARLALVHSSSWRTIGNSSHPQDPAIYVPGWIPGKSEDKSLRVLIGFDEAVLKQRNSREPLWREFSTDETPSRLGGHLAEFHNISTVAVAVQCAARGDVHCANLLWSQFTNHENSGGKRSVKFYREAKEQPDKLWATMLFDHLELLIANPGADLLVISEKIDALLKEFPALADDRRMGLAKQLLDTVKLKPPEDGSIEALLIACGQAGEQGARQHGEKMTIIIRRGFDAIPELLRLQHDTRLTASRYSETMGQESAPKPLGDFARSALAELLPDAEGIRADHDRPVRGDFDKEWKNASKEGEQAYYLRLAWKRDRQGKFDFSRGALCVLAAKAQDEFASLIVKFNREAKYDTSCGELSHAILASELPPAQKSKLLLELADKGGIARVRPAIQALAFVDPESAKEPARKLMKILPKDSPGEYWTSPIAAVSQVVLTVDDDEVWETFLAKSRQAEVGLRLEWMNPCNYLYVGDRLKSRRLAFLAAFLDDQTIRDDSKNAKKYGGPCAGFTFHQIAVRNFSAMKIASILEINPLDPPDATWTKEQWSQLRIKVAERLKKEEVEAMH